jgi:hypothetical protein
MLFYNSETSAVFLVLVCIHYGTTLQGFRDVSVMQLMMILSKLMGSVFFFYFRFIPNTTVRVL